MSDNLGPGVSRVVSPEGASFDLVIWQADKPPLDSELDLVQQVESDWRRTMVMRGTPSGWIENPTNPGDAFVTNATYSNWFQFGRQRAGETKAIAWAVVNGWVIPVSGTQTGNPPGSPDNTNTWNRVTLDPPPSNAGDQRVDFVFLEVWRARIPSGAASTKPQPDKIYKYGNVEGGASYLPDNLIDPEIGAETTQRVQLQYRIRVVRGLVGLATNPDGFDPTTVKAQGSAPVATSYTFTNMRQELGDAGLWRAGDGSNNSQTALGSVDGYTYAIPLSLVFRRNSVAWNGDPGPNLNGAVNRNPTATNRAGWKTFSTVATLGADLSASALTLTLAPYTANTLPMPATPASPVVIQVGDELITYQAISGTNMTLVARGANGTRAETHKAGTPVVILSGRPDGLFSDQIARTDILDIRHIVNPNGFDYQALLKANLAKLMKGDLQANWKRSAATQGPFLFYQDVATNSPVALGTARLDGPNNVRRVWSDASTLETVEVIVEPAPVPPVFPAVAQIASSWSLALSANTPQQAVGNQFSAGDIIVIPINTFQQGLGADIDQVRFVNDGISYAVEIRINGKETTLDSSLYTVTPLNPGAGNDLTITFNAGTVYPITGVVSITVRVFYGPGRGMSRRPDSFHSASMLTNTGGEFMLSASGVPSTNLPLRPGWFPLWSRFRGSVFNGLVPVTGEMYVDPASKTVALTPFRRITYPQVLTQDGFAVNLLGGFGSFVSNGVSTGTNTFSNADGLFNGAYLNKVLVIKSGSAKGSYYITAVLGPNLLQVQGNIPVTTLPPSEWTFQTPLGLMPTVDNSLAPKWVTTDPLELFAGSVVGPNNNAAQSNLYVTLPRHLIPGWGEVRSPLMLPGNPVFDQGVNLFLQSKEGGVYSDTNHNPQYINYVNGAVTYAVFSTHNLTALPGTVAATYNALTPTPGVAGVRFFTDTRGLSRKGLELPPFYGVARLFAVYEAQDYATNGSAYVASTRAPIGVGSPAINLLRQNFDGPYFWVEIDADGDSTFILNADALDLSKSSVVAIPNFASGRYVIEASIFGFDRGSFDPTQPFRLVMSRNRTIATDNAVRSNNLGVLAPGPTTIVPGPLQTNDKVVLNYSHTVYQGDPWGSTSAFNDSPQVQGPLTSSSAFQLASTKVNEAALTRPNQKVLEVLAGTTFLMTAGTGRLAGDNTGSTSLDVRNVGYENPASYPPSSAVDPRPRSLLGALGGQVLGYGTDFAGATERLPLGSLFRDKDFRGEAIASNRGSVVFEDNVEATFTFPALATNHQREQKEALVHQASLATGDSGDVLVHVDGEQANYVPLVNFRTNRGGSLFSAGGARPGGEVGAKLAAIQDPSGHTNVLCGRAFLVRNHVTTVGLSEVSAGDELMLLVLTTVKRLTNGLATQGEVLVSTNGTGEGYSAADLYRIEGHPLMVDSTRLDLDPSTITLSKRTTLWLSAI